MVSRPVELGHLQRLHRLLLTLRPWRISTSSVLMRAEETTALLAEAGEAFYTCAATHPPRA